MERFCSSCGTLVSGNGEFCPNCGAAMKSAIDLGKPTDTNINLTKPEDNAAAQGIPAPAPVPTPNTNTYSSTGSYNTSGNQGTIPNYGNVNVNINTAPPSDEMTLKQWVWTIIAPGLLGSVTCGIGQIILLIVWACSNSIPICKKRFAQAQLIWLAISVVLVILVYVLYFVLVMGVMGLSMSEIMGEMDSSYYSYY